MRAAVESAQDTGSVQDLDPWLLALRELEAAAMGMPLELGGVRRGRLWDQDPISVTFEGYDTSTQARVAVRALRPGLVDDPVWRRRLARSVRWVPGPEVLVPTELRADPWPHVRIDLTGPSLADLLPVEDPPDAAALARLLGGALLSLEALHSNGLVHGDVRAEHLILGPGLPRLVWLDALLPRGGSVSQDLRDLGATIALLDPDRIDPVGQIAHSMAEDPPPDTTAARLLLQRTLSEHLADRRHSLAMRRRDQARRDRESHLWSLVRRLSESLAPPTGSWCLRAGQDTVLIVAESDGVRVRGGPVAGVPSRFMPVVWSPEGGLDAIAARALLRGWATRRTGNEERRAQLQEQLGADDAGARAMCRWLSCQSRLRSVRLLLELGRR